MLFARLVAAARTPWAQRGCRRSSPPQHQLSPCARSTFSAARGDRAEVDDASGGHSPAPAAEPTELDEADAAQPTRFLPLSRLLTLWMYPIQSPPHSLEGPLRSCIILWHNRICARSAIIKGSACLVPSAQNTSFWLAEAMVHTGDNYNDDAIDAADDDADGRNVNKTKTKEH